MILSVQPRFVKTSRLVEHARFSWLRLAGVS
jgi:hypothetical protein